MSAPAGTGKTTLLAEWVQRDLQGRAAWLSIDRRDDDPVRFWMYVLAAIQTLEPDLGIGTLDLLSSRGGGDSVEVAEALVAELGALDEPFALTLVLDDLHNLSERSIYEGLDSLIQRRPPGMRIVLSTRADPLLRLGRFRASGNLMELRQADLRFSSLEAEELFRTPEFRLEPADLDLLVDRTEGWIMALQMAAVALRGNKDVGRYLEQIAILDSTLADYLVAEVMDDLPGEVREFLLLTSVLEELLPEACDAVTRHHDSWRILTYLRQHNLFLVAPDASRSAPRYHHLFAELLRVELRSIDPEAERAANLRAARWFRSAGDSASAMDHFFAAQAYDEALGVLMDNAVGYYDSGLARSMIGWIERFPPASSRASRGACSILPRCSAATVVSPKPRTGCNGSRGGPRRPSTSIPCCGPGYRRSGLSPRTWRANRTSPSSGSSGRSPGATKQPTTDTTLGCRWPWCGAGVGSGTPRPPGRPGREPTRCPRCQMTWRDR